MDFKIFNSDIIKFELTTWLVGLYIIILGIAYFLIFRKHHKRNHVEIFELVSLVTKFFVITTISIIIILFGVDCIITSHEYSDVRSDVIAGLTLGIVIISGTIINYIFYLKDALRDYIIAERTENNRRTQRIGEILQLICFIMVICMPLWRIPYFIKVFDDKQELWTDLIRSFVISFVAMFVLYNLNPLDFRGYFARKFLGEEVKNEEEKVEEVEVKEEEPKEEKKKTKRKTSTSSKSKTKETTKKTTKKSTSKNSKSKSTTGKTKSKNSKKS